MKTFALGLAVGASLISTAAFAGQQRPTYLAFKAPAAAPVGSVSVAPVGPAVSKRNSAIGGVPLFVPLIGVVAVVALVAAVSSGGGGNDGSPG